MGKKDQKKKAKKDKGSKEQRKKNKADKEEARLAKKAAKKGGGDAGKEDIDALLEEAIRQNREQTTVEVIDRGNEKPSVRANFSLAAREIETADGAKAVEVLLFGGEYFDGESSRCYCDLYFWRPSNRNNPTDVCEWRQVRAPSPPPPRCSHQAVVIGSKMYLFGGEFTTKDQFRHYNDLWTFDMDSHTWEQIGVRGAPSPRSGHRMVAWRHWLVVFGGFYEAADSTEWFHDLHLFDTLHRIWRKVPFLSCQAQPEPRSGCALLPHPDTENHPCTLLLYGGVQHPAKRDFKVFADMWQLHLDPLVRDNSSMRAGADSGSDSDAGDSLGVGVGASGGVVGEPFWSRVPKKGEFPTNRSGLCMSSVRVNASQGDGGVQGGSALVMFGGVFDKPAKEKGKVHSFFYNEIFAYDCEGGRWWKIGLDSDNSETSDKVLSKLSKKDAREAEDRARFMRRLRGLPASAEDQARARTLQAYEDKEEEEEVQGAEGEALVVEAEAEAGAEAVAVADVEVAVADVEVAVADVEVAVADVEVAVAEADMEAEAVEAVEAVVAEEVTEVEALVVADAAEEADAESIVAEAAVAEAVIVEAEATSDEAGAGAGGSAFAAASPSARYGAKTMMLPFGNRVLLCVYGGMVEPEQLQQGEGADVDADAGVDGGGVGEAGAAGAGAPKVVGVTWHAQTTDERKQEFEAHVANNNEIQNALARSQAMQTTGNTTLTVSAEHDRGKGRASERQVTLDDVWVIDIAGAGALNQWECWSEGTMDRQVWKGKAEKEDEEEAEEEEDEAAAEEAAGEAAEERGDEQQEDDPPSEGEMEESKEQKSEEPGDNTDLVLAAYFEENPEQLAAFEALPDAVKAVSKPAFEQLATAWWRENRSQKQDEHETVVEEKEEEEEEEGEGSRQGQRREKKKGKRAEKEKLKKMKSRKQKSKEMSKRKDKSRGNADY